MTVARPCVVEGQIFSFAFGTIADYFSTKKIIKIQGAKFFNCDVALVYILRVDQLFLAALLHHKEESIQLTSKTNSEVQSACIMCDPRYIVVVLQRRGGGAWQQRETGTSTKRYIRSSQAATVAGAASFFFSGGREKQCDQIS